MTWGYYDDDSSRIDVHQQRYAASGAKVGIETQVNSTPIGNQSDADVTALADGGWVIMWETSGNVGMDIYQQRYAVSGVKVGGETLFNISTDGYSDTAPVTSLADGGWVIAWSGGSGLYQQRYDAAGNPVGG
ncbi:hypothetical protein [Pseudomonas fluorescens]|uniref:Uncharacterized protein n=1 Tax=Pseudomonas fluorescens TaxID=294 RepID=A0A5E7Q8Q2_PSEFL|nr:hypothetical protein [Pseudomonas fluorescens]VVP58069.1 hypothetical protein PS880_05877 [Pseudomonas fluorescens]